LVSIKTYKLWQTNNLAPVLKEAPQDVQKVREAVKEATIQKLLQITDHNKLSRIIIATNKDAGVDKKWFGNWL
jgi:hypothetical protein